MWQRYFENEISKKENFYLSFKKGKGFANVNPCGVFTADRLDANQYAVFLVPTPACINAVLGEPRFLSICPDAVAIDCQVPISVLFVSVLFIIQHLG